MMSGLVTNTYLQKWAFFMSPYRDAQSKDWAMTTSLLSQTGELGLALHSPVILPDSGIVQSTATWTLRRRRCRDCTLAHGTRSDAWGRRAEWSWAAGCWKFLQGPEHEDLLHWFLCFMPTFAVPFLSQVCIWSLWFIHLWKLLVQLVWTTAADRDSAHLPLLHSRFLCLLTACFSIQSSRYFLICFVVEQVQCAKRRGPWQQLATAGRVLQPRQTFTSTSIMVFPTLGPQLQWQLTPHTS